MATVTILGIIDVTDQVVEKGQESAHFDATNFIVQSRDILITDSSGALAPFSSDGILSPDRNGWKNQPVEVLDDDGLLEYSGIIQDIEEVSQDGQTIITLKTLNTLGSLLPFPIEENTKILNFTTDKKHGKGTDQLKITGGIGILPDICVMSTEQNLVPSFQVVKAEGTPNTTSILLDRGIDSELPNLTPLIFSIPRFDTPATFLKRAFQTALAVIGQSDRLDESSFDEIIAEQEATDEEIFVYIRKEDNISLGAHVSKLLELGDLLIQEAEGKLRLIRGFAWDGTHPRRCLDEDIIIEPIIKKRDQARSIFAYNMLFQNGAKIENKFRELDATDPAVRDSGAIRPFTPIEPKGINVIGHQYLFDDEATAESFGDRRLLYYKFSRQQIVFNLKPRFPDGQIINLKQFDVFLLNLRITPFESYINEPIRILSFDKNDNDLRIENVVVELINNPTPGLPKPS